MIQLTDDLYLGKGRTRGCFIDPRDPARCIKVDFVEKGYHQTAKEGAYYRKLQKIRPGLTYDFIPGFHGFVETSRGRGGVFDLIADETTGRPAGTLGHYLRDGSIARDIPVWQRALDEFLHKVLTSAVIIRDWNPGNLCARMRLDGSVQLVAIDGIGHRDFIPVWDYFPALARRKLRRQIARKGMTSIRDLLERHERMKRKHLAGRNGPTEVSP